MTSPQPLSGGEGLSTNKNPERFRVFLMPTYNGKDTSIKRIRIIICCYDIVERTKRIKLEL